MARRSAWRGRAVLGFMADRRASLFLVLNVQPHKYFKRRENDILLNLDINVAQAALGAEIKVPTIDGDEKLRSPRGPSLARSFICTARVSRTCGGADAATRW